MDFSVSDINIHLDGLPPINLGSVETFPGFGARVAQPLFSIGCGRMNKKRNPPVGTGFAEVAVCVVRGKTP